MTTAVANDTDSIVRDAVANLNSLSTLPQTTANIIAAVEGGKETIDETRAWLKSSLNCFFETSSTRDFLFNAPIWYLRRSD